MNEPLDNLLAQLCSGNAEAAEQAFRTYEPYLRLAVRRHLPDPLRAKFDSADIVQSVWADMLRGFRDAGWHFNDADHLRGFLFVATRNRLIDRVREHQKALAREEPLGEGGLHALPSPRPRPSEVAQAGDLWERILAHCPPEHHSIVRLRRQGYSLAEIAEQTGLHPDSIRRILRTLARQLAFSKDQPYFGGATLAQLLEALRPRPPARRTGQDLLDALDRVQASAPLSPVRPAGRQALAGASYVRVVCWQGACLADALQYAHERGLAHLDLKPSNVLISAEGSPMLLDFHLAREPIHPGGADAAMCRRLGGTAGYMSPEQQSALLALEQHQPIPLPVDGRSDVYSLGVVLYEVLAGDLPAPGGRPRPLQQCNAQVSVGLSDVIGKCLAGNPGDRYPRPADLAADLRRHLADLPLAGVRNRGLRERWRKWRRRRPYGVALAGMLLAVLTAAVAVALGAATSFRQRVEQARAALNDGQAQMDNGQWEAAVGTLRRGLSVARATPFQGALADELGRRLSVAERAAVAGELHHLAGRVRFLYGGDGLAPGSLGGLEARCRALWENRGRIVERLRPAGGAAGEPSRDDLLDLAIIWADLQVRLAPSAGKGEARARARAVLAEAEALFGPSPVLDEERRFHGGPAGPSSARGTSTPSAWEHYALGRALLRSGNLARAAEELDQAVRLQPQGLWPNFYQGQCEYRRGNYEAAVLASSVCIGAAPGAAGCFYNRALAAEALGRPGQALDDYTRALRLDPTLASAALNRGMLHYRAGRPAEARADLRAARDLGADPAAVSFDLALVHLALGERGAALAELRRALGHDPDQPDARRLHDSLLGRQR